MQWECLRTVHWAWLRCVGGVLWAALPGERVCAGRGCVCVGGRGCVEAHVQEQKGFGLMERAPQLLTAE